MDSPTPLANTSTPSTNTPTPTTNIPSPTTNTPSTSSTPHPNPSETSTKPRSPKLTFLTDLSRLINFISIIYSSVHRFFQYSIESGASDFKKLKQCHQKCKIVKNKFFFEAVTLCRTNGGLTKTSLSHFRDEIRKISLYDQSEFKVMHGIEVMSSYDRKYFVQKFYQLFTQLQISSHHLKIILQSYECMVALSPSCIHNLTSFVAVVPPVIDLSITSWPSILDPEKLETIPQAPDNEYWTLQINSFRDIVMKEPTAFIYMPIWNEDSDTDSDVETDDFKLYMEQRRQIMSQIAIPKSS